jgi:hypothetical protein
LSQEEVQEQVRAQLEEVLTSKEAIAENERRNKRVLEAIKAFGESILL